MELNPQKQSQAAALAIVLRVGRDLVPQVYQSISRSSGKATCWVVPRANTTGGICCTTYGRTMWSSRSSAGAIRSLPGWCVMT